MWSFGSFFESKSIHDTIIGIGWRSLARDLCLFSFRPFFFNVQCAEEKAFCHGSSVFQMSNYVTESEFWGYGPDRLVSGWSQCNE